MGLTALGILLAVPCLGAGPAPDVASRLQAVDALAGQVRGLRSRVEQAGKDRKSLQTLAKQLDGWLAGASFDRGLSLAQREEVAIRVAAQLEPAVNAASVALQLAAGQTETAEDRWAAQARDAATQLYAWREAVLHASGKTDAEAVFARIAPLLASARPPASASADARQDFADVAESAAWALRRALYPLRDPHAGKDYDAALATVRKWLALQEDRLAHAGCPMPATNFSRPANESSGSATLAPARPDQAAAFQAWRAARIADAVRAWQEAAAACPKLPATPPTRP